MVDEGAYWLELPMLHVANITLSAINYFPSRQTRLILSQANSFSVERSNKLSDRWELEWGVRCFQHTACTYQKCTKLHEFSETESLMNIYTTYYIVYKGKGSLRTSWTASLRDANCALETVLTCVSYCMIISFITASRIKYLTCVSHEWGGDHENEYGVTMTHPFVDGPKDTFCTRRGGQGAHVSVVCLSSHSNLIWIDPLNALIFIHLATTMGTR